MALRPRGAASPADLEELTVAPGVAPWVSGRVGIADDNEAGISYTGRLLRIDARHAFNNDGGPTLSLGLGASAVIAQRPGRTNEGSSVYGGALDVPILIGVHTRSDLYALWIGPRASIELLSGRLNLNGDPSMPADFVDAKARHWTFGGVAGFRLGFRHVHVAIEIDGGYHRADGTIGDATLVVNQFAIVPSGALLFTF